MSNLSLGELPPVLYHYQPVHTAEYEQRLRTLLTDQILYCSSPSQFNDPWDCKPYYRPEDFHDLALSEDGAHWLAQMFAEPKDLPQVIAHLRQNPIFRAKILHNLQNEMEKIMEQRWRIYCLSPSPDINLMWSHYAYSHSGVSLGFGTSNAVFSRVWKVFYSATYPVIRIQDNQETSTRKLLLSKSDDWAYEREYRILARPVEFEIRGTEGRGLTTKNHFLSLPDNALQVIIVGCRGNYQRIKSMVDECAPDIAVRKAVVERDSYQVKIQDA